MRFVHAQRMFRATILARMTRESFRRWRIEHELTQTEIAARLGLSYRTIQDWESGARPGVGLPWVELALAELGRRLAPAAE